MRALTRVARWRLRSCSSSIEQLGAAAQQPELFVGDVIQAAIHDGLQIQSLQVSKEPFLDIGTPDDLVRALRDLASRGK